MATGRHLWKLAAIAAMALAGAAATRDRHIGDRRFLEAANAVVRCRRFPYAVTIRMGDKPQRHVEAMLQASSTFRDRCRRLVEFPVARVTIRQNVGLLARSFRAKSRIERLRARPILALVEITPAESPAEWIAHEFDTSWSRWTAGSRRNGRPRAGLALVGGHVRNGARDSCRPESGGRAAAGAPRDARQTCRVDAACSTSL
jgi:hypothetical protein